MNDAAVERASLEFRQKAGERVEKRMMECMLGFEPTISLRVYDVQFIARMARQYAFDEFNPDAKAAS
jgi:hypothetical protein